MDKIDSREVGLLIGLKIERYLLQADDLHYGYWPPDLKVEISNWAEAQANHSNLILRNIPAGVRSILDVGCGAGTFTQKLAAAGYSVDAVSPSPLLSQEARRRLPESARIFPSTLEALDCDRRYDLVLFSESFQYVRMSRAFPKILSVLNDGGHLLICDFFKKDTEGVSALGGGHKLSKFYARMAEQPFEKVTDQDITAEIAPTMDLVDGFLREVGQPVRDLTFQFLGGRYPLLTRFLAWKFKRQLGEVDRKYFSGERNGAMFQKFKSYRLMLFRRK